MLLIARDLDLALLKGIAVIDELNPSSRVLCDTEMPRFKSEKTCCSNNCAPASSEAGIKAQRCPTRSLTLEAFLKDEGYEGIAIFQPQVVDWTVETLRVRWRVRLNEKCLDSHH